jgi:hypothetical protein
VKYFSGTAAYVKTVDAPESWFRDGTRLLLDLGRVNDLAEISVNGEALGTLWKPPYQVDITTALKPGVNKMEIKVTNQWTNRVIGDRAAPPQKRVLSELPPIMKGLGTPEVLRESGLLGPVTIISTHISPN